MRLLALFVSLFFIASPAAADESEFAVDAHITVLSTMLANFSGHGEWGFSALIETRDGSILFDT